jgi:hypothetical protein
MSTAITAGALFGLPVLVKSIVEDFRTPNHALTQA